MLNGGGSALNIFSIFYTHHRYRIPNKHMTINFDTITNNYEVIYVIKTVMKYYLKKNRYEFSSASSKYGSTFICWRHKWRDLVYEYSWAKSPMISGYVTYLITEKTRFIYTGTKEQTLRSWMCIAWKQKLSTLLRGIRVWFDATRPRLCLSVLKSLSLFPVLF